MKYWLICAICIILNTYCQAQEEALKYERTDISLKEVLEEIRELYQLNISYALGNNEHTYENLSVSGGDFTSFINNMFEELLLNVEWVGEQSVAVSGWSRINRCIEIRDGTSGELLSFSNVVNSVTGHGTSADAAGRVLWNMNNPTIDRLIISYVGYEDKVLPLEYKSTNKCINIYLELDTTMSPNIIVRDYIIEGLDISEQGQATVFRVRDIDNLPGMVEKDVIQSLQFLPGIQSTSSKASDIYIRGSATDQTLISWEHIPIYHTGHYFGSISSINAFSANKASVYRGTYNAEQGGRVGAFVDLRFDPRDDDLTFSMNGLHCGLSGTKEILSKSQTKLSFSVRRSYDEVWRSPTVESFSNFNQQGFIIGDRNVSSLPGNIEVENDFNYFDGMFHLQSNLGPRDRLLVSGLLKTNSFNGFIEDNSEARTQTDSFEITSNGGSIEWGRSWSRKWTSKIVASTAQLNQKSSFFLRDDDLGEIVENGLKENKLQDSQFKISSAYQLNNGSIGFGFHTTYYDISYSVVEETNFSKNIQDQNQNTGSVQSVFGSYKSQLWRGFDLDLSTRVSTYSNISDEVYYEPRLQLKQTIGKSFNLIGSVGRHHQFIGQVRVFRGNERGLETQLWAMTDKKSIPLQTANYYQLGFFFERAGWLIELQAYERDIKGISSRAYDFEFSDDDEVSIGDLLSRGVDLLVKKKYRGIQSWLSYSYGTADLEFRSLVRGNFPAHQDIRHNLRWSQQVSWKSIKFGYTAQWNSGLPYTELERFRLTSGPREPEEYEFFWGDVNQERLAENFEFNVSMGYEFRSERENYVIEFSLSALNLFGNNNQFNRSYFLNKRRNSPTELRFVNFNNLLRTINAGIVISL